jgi:predicted anti-sigma-YlaC factor YlaD
MTCELMRDVICEYIDGELESEQIVSIEAHLQHCPACRSEVDELRETLAWVKQATHVTPPAGLRQAVLETIKKEKSIRISRRFAPGFTQAVAAAAIFIFLVAGNITLTRMPGTAGMPKGTFEIQSAPGIMEESTIQGLESADTIPPEDSSEIRVATKELNEVTTDSTGLSVGSYGRDSGAQAANGRMVKYYRIIMNAMLLPLFAVFAWLAIKRRKVV